MNKLVIVIVLSIIIGGYAFSDNIKREKTKTLIIRWQRLVDEKGQTCERCGSTEHEVQKALQVLEKSLTPLGIKVTLEKIVLDPKTCAKDISQSNRIWIGKRSLEEWLNAQVGNSLCGFCCAELGDSVECRTVIFEEKIFEVIPATLIIKAGLQAASQMLLVAEDEPCCPEKTPSGEPCEVPCGDSPERDGDSNKHN